MYVVPGGVSVETGGLSVGSGGIAVQGGITLISGKLELPTAQGLDVNGGGLRASTASPTDPAATLVASSVGYAGA